MTIHKIGIDLRSGAAFDEASILQAEAATKRSLFGGFDQATFSTLSAAASNATFSVDVWGFIYEPAWDPIAVRTDPVTKLQRAQFLATASQGFLGALENTLVHSGVTYITIDPGAPYLRATGPASALLSLSSDMSIASIRLAPPALAPYSAYAINTEDDQAQDAGWIGTGQCILIDDVGVPNTSTLVYIIDGGVWLPDAGHSGHPNEVAEVIHESLAPPGGPGFSPGALTYFGVSYPDQVSTFPYNDVIWGTQIDLPYYPRCLIVNHSAGFNPFGNPYADPDFYNMYYDYVNRFDPSPLFVTAAGNNYVDPDSGIANDAGYADNLQYNGLDVGCSSIWNGSYSDGGWFGECSAWQNPPTTHHDKEVPNLCAPNTATSLSTPEVSAAVAVLLQAGKTLGNDTEAQRAIIMATATWNLESPPGVPTQYVSLAPGHPDYHCGVGELNVFHAAELGQESNLFPPQINWQEVFDAGGATQAWYGGYFRTADGGANGPYWRGPFLYTPSGAHSRVRFVLAQDASATCSNWEDPTTCYPDQLQDDLDVVAYDAYTGLQIGSSATFDNSWEVIDIPTNAALHCTLFFRNNCLRWAQDNIKFLVMGSGSTAAGDFGAAFYEYR